MALYHSPDYQTNLTQLAFQFEKKFNIDFQDGSHLRFLIRAIFASFDLQVTFILLMKFPVNCPSGQKVQTWLLEQPSWIFNQNGFSYVIPILPIKFRVNGPFCSGEEVQNRF